MNISVAATNSLTALVSVIKSRLQAGHLKYRSFLDGVLTILQNEGLEGLYKGMGNKLLQSVLTAAILFAGQRRFYELTKQVRPSLRIFPRRWCLTTVSSRPSPLAMPATPRTRHRHSRRLANSSSSSLVIARAAVQSIYRRETRRWSAVVCCART